MSVRPYRDIFRRKSRQIFVGNVPVGGDAPITVQTMTNTLTADAKATIAQIQACADAGADIVRVSCPDEASTAAMPEICKASPVPIVADIHFHYKRAIEAAEAGAACLRINPGNIGNASRVREVVKAAKDHGCSIRVGVNAGSLEKHLLEKYGEPCPEAMVESALDHLKILEDNDFYETKISVKASDVFLAVAAYQGLADACDYPLHLGITEAGGFRIGSVKSSIGMGAEPENATSTEEISASTGRCISADTAVGTVIIKLLFQRSMSFQKLSKHFFTNFFKQKRNKIFYREIFNFIISISNS